MPPIAALPAGLVPTPTPSSGPAPLGYGQAGQSAPSGPGNQADHSGQSGQASQPPQYGYGDSPLPGSGSDSTATQTVRVGTVQPREPRPAGGSVDEAERILGRAVDALGADPA